jgi:hypothetical protein
VNPDWLPPAYLSPSQISSLTTCGEQYRLTRVEGAPERPMWAGIGGSTVHKITEILDLNAYDGLTEGMTIEELWERVWNECFDEAKERHPEFDPEDYYRSGRVSKEWPEKETPEWWAVKGPSFVKQWIMWRDNNGLSIWETLDEETGELRPAIELEVNAYGPDDLYVKSVIDRVYIDQEGDLRIVDLKTGSHTDAWPRQMAYNALGVSCQHGEQPRYAGFWKARSGGIPEWFDLSVFTEEWLWEQAHKARAIRDQQLFLAAPNNLCKSACGVSQWCVAMGGTPFFRKDATMTHNTSDKENEQ